MNHKLLNISPVYWFLAVLVLVSGLALAPVVTAMLVLIIESYFVQQSTQSS